MIKFIDVEDLIRVMESGKWMIPIDEQEHDSLKSFNDGIQFAILKLIAQSSLEMLTREHLDVLILARSDAWRDRYTDDEWKLIHLGATNLRDIVVAYYSTLSSPVTVVTDAN